MLNGVKLEKNNQFFGGFMAILTSKNLGINRKKAVVQEWDEIYLMAHVLSSRLYQNHGQHKSQEIRQKNKNRENKK